MSLGGGKQPTAQNSWEITLNEANSKTYNTADEIILIQ